MLLASCFEPFLLTAVETGGTGFYLPVALPPVIPHGPGTEDVTCVNGRNEASTAGFVWIYMLCLNHQPFHMDIYYTHNQTLTQIPQLGGGGSVCAK